MTAITNDCSWLMPSKRPATLPPCTRRLSMLPRHRSRVPTPPATHPMTPARRQAVSVRRARSGLLRSWQITTSATHSQKYVTSSISDSGPVSPRVADAMLATQKATKSPRRSEEHTSELQSHSDLVCRLLLEKKKKKRT